MDKYVVITTEKKLTSEEIEDFKSRVLDVTGIRALVLDMGATLNVVATCSDGETTVVRTY